MITERCLNNMTLYMKKKTVTFRCLAEKFFEKPETE